MKTKQNKKHIVNVQSERQMIPIKSFIENELPNGSYDFKWQLPYGEDGQYLRCILENIAE